jgi:two-component system NtrC family sensor kinase
MSIVAASIGSYLDRKRSFELRTLAEKELLEMRSDHDASMSRQVTIARRAALKQVASELHAYKNVLVKLGGWIREVEKMNSASERVELKRKVSEQVQQILPDIEQKLLLKDVREVFSPAERIRSLMKGWSFELQSKRIKVERDLQPDLSIYMPPDTFDEVLYNLVSNAIRSLSILKSPKEKKIDIRCCLLSEGSTRYFALDVGDNGGGIRNEDKDRIFEEGFTTFRDAGGTGMGLSLVRSLVREHGGKIQAVSSFGHGATFEVRIPYSRIKP